MGKLVLPVKGPGLFLIIPGIDRVLRISLQTSTMDMSAQEFSTVDRGAIRLDASVSFRVTDPEKAVSEVENYLYAMSQLAKEAFLKPIGG